MTSIAAGAILIARVGIEKHIAIALASLLATACSSAAIPPSRIAIGGGVSMPHGRRSEPALDLRWSVHPLAMVEHVRSRRVDVGMGWGGTISSPGTRGPELFGEYFFLPGPAQGGGFRAGVLGSAQVVLTSDNDRPARGVGGSLGLDFEHVGFVQAEDDEGALGEWALGGYATARYVEADGLRMWSFVGGLEARVPLAVKP